MRLFCLMQMVYCCMADTLWGHSFLSAILASISRKRVFSGSARDSARVTSSSPSLLWAPGWMDCALKAARGTVNALLDWSRRCLAGLASEASAFSRAAPAVGRCRVRGGAGGVGAPPAAAARLANTRASLVSKSISSGSRGLNRGELNYSSLVTGI